MMASKKGKIASNHLKKIVLNKLNEQVHPDTISCVDGDHYLTFGNTICVSHSVSVYYKWIDGVERLDITELVHTLMQYYL